MNGFSICLFSKKQIRKFSYQHWHTTISYFYHYFSVFYLLFCLSLSFTLSIVYIYCWNSIKQTFYKIDKYLLSGFIHAEKEDESDSIIKMKISYLHQLTRENDEVSKCYSVLYSNKQLKCCLNRYFRLKPILYLDPISWRNWESSANNTQHFSSLWLTARWHIIIIINILLL